ncbi:hypothetical protein AMAG_11437 [Allomyces macrogynus ATCC 38327]|uniref:Cytochrome P450 n=1 Tax=Allomyces macrogynus (strain ATCC 38327) TaxID=578462 RepID=A0A0L0SXB0_ALLM3|nr:hypothetical protein AMAG_11437 [Allomyces macrogynus ATCC 38327]|eukprot:KNE66964.1 hypothetical protein AMAG_11437 [Allomyces macrogynus ATCC 38327]
MGNNISVVTDPAVAALSLHQHAVALAPAALHQGIGKSNVARTITTSIAALTVLWTVKDLIHDARQARWIRRQGVPEQSLRRRRWWLFGLHRYLLGHMLETKPAFVGDRRGPELMPLLHGEEGIDGWDRPGVEPLIFLSRFVLGAPKIIVADPKALHTVFSANSYRFVKTPIGVRLVGMATGDAGLVVVQGEVHKRHRRIINPLFSMKMLKPLVPAMLTSLDEFYALADQSTSTSAPLPFHDLSSDLTLNVIGRTAMNYDLDALSPQGSRVSRAYRKAVDALKISMWLMLTLQFPNTFGRIPSRKMANFWREMGVVDEAIKDMLRNAAMDPDGPTLIHELLRQNAGNALSEHELMCEIRTFLAAGHETTSSTLASCVLLLAQYPEIQQELLEELETVDDLTDYDMLSKLPRLNAIINETSRLFPAVFITFRDVGEGGATIPTTALGPLELPKGFRIEVPIRGIHCDPHIWGPDALTWNPWRWDSIDLVHGLTELPAQRVVDGRRQIGQYDFMPFLAGPRACIGRQFAVMELRLFVAGIVKRYKLSTDVPIGGEELQCAITMRMTNAWVRFERRDTP